MSRPYAKLWRDLDAAGLTRNHKACALYCHILCAASVTARRVVFNGVTVNLQPGQMVTSRSELSAYLGLTEKEVRGAIKTLEKLQLVDQQGASKYTLISLIDSDGCNNEGPTEGQQEGQERAKSGPAEGPDKGQLLYKEEECRQKMEHESFSNSAQPEPAPAQKPASKPKARPVLEGRSLELFNQFWDAFNFKQSRKQAEKAWADISGMTEELAAKICEAARREAALRPQYAARGRTPKYPQGWLNDRRWEDDYDQREAMESQQSMPRQGSLFAQTQAGQPKTWDEIRNEKNRQACLEALNELYPEQGCAPQEESYEPDHWTAEVLEDE